MIFWEIENLLLSSFTLKWSCWNKLIILLIFIGFTTWTILLKWKICTALFKKKLPTILWRECIYETNPWISFLCVWLSSIPFNYIQCYKHSLHLFYCCILHIFHAKSAKSFSCSSRTIPNAHIFENLHSTDCS